MCNLRSIVTTAKGKQNRKYRMRAESERMDENRPEGKIAIQLCNVMSKLIYFHRLSITFMHNHFCFGKLHITSKSVFFFWILNAFSHVIFVVFYFLFAAEKTTLKTDWNSSIGQFHPNKIEWPKRLRWKLVAANGTCPQRHVLIIRIIDLQLKQEFEIDLIKPWTLLFSSRFPSLFPLHS